MQFSQFATYLETIESQSKRLAITETLSQLFKEASKEEIGYMCYLLQGRLSPRFETLDLQLAEKMMIRVIATVVGDSVENVTKQFKETGDLGITFVAESEKRKVESKELSVIEVYKELKEIALESGSGSQERKLNRMIALLNRLDTLSGKFIARMVVKKLRLGFSDMTIIDALSWMTTGTKELRPALEAAFNVRADIGQIAEIFKQGGIEAIQAITPVPGIPIRPAKATPLKDSQEIFEKMSGLILAEPKFDGFRVQIHLDKDQDFSSPLEKSQDLFESKEPLQVQVFSRNLENMTEMVPDIVSAVSKLPIQSAIFDGEAIALDSISGEYLDFQETMKRKRKHDIANHAEKTPLTSFIFDLLYLNGKSWIDKPFSERREQLQKLFSQKGVLQIAEQHEIKDLETFEKFFKKVAEQRLEGLMAKKKDSTYRAGARDFTWVKYKVAMQSELADTVDVVVMGYFKGQGKWAELGLGKVLVGIPDGGRIVSLSKVGSGFSEEVIKEMVERCKLLRTKDKSDNYVVDPQLVPDIWVEPKLVIELRADSISKSTIYTGGFSLRFPRFIRFRGDKNVEDATNLQELQRLAGNNN